MKKMLLILSLCWVSYLCSQGVLESLYYKLPSEYCLDFDMERKKSAIEDMKFNDFLDEKNGFLSYNIFQCHYEVCYWNLKESGSQSRLVAVNGADGCGHRIYFFIEREGKLTHCKMEIFDSFNAFFFFKKDTKLKDIKPEADMFIYHLPRKGRNITVHYGSPYLGAGDGNLLLKGDKIDFIWNNGDFKMGEPYF